MIQRLSTDTDWLRVELSLHFRSCAEKEWTWSDSIDREDRRQASTRKTTEDVFGLGGNRWSGVEILKLCQRREEHQLIANVRFWHVTTTGQLGRKGKGQPHPQTPPPRPSAPPHYEILDPPLNNSVRWADVHVDYCNSRLEREINVILSLEVTLDNANEKDAFTSQQMQCFIYSTVCYFNTGYVKNHLRVSLGISPLPLHTGGATRASQRIRPIQSSPVGTAYQQKF